VIPKTQLGWGVYYGQPVFLLPSFMPLEEQGFDLGFALAGCQFVIPKAAGQIQSSIAVGVVPISTHHTAEGALVRSVGPINIMAAVYVDKSVTH